MVKVVKNINNTPIAHIKIKPNPVKFIKLSTSGEGCSQVRLIHHYHIFKGSVDNGIAVKLFYVASFCP